MKTPEYRKALRAKSAAELKTELTSLVKEQFNLRMQKITGQQAKSHLITQARKNIARVKTLQSSQAKAVKA